MEKREEAQGERLTPYLSPAGAWAISLGTSIGWGSFVITSNSYLAKAGPYGSVIGMLIGAIVMMLIARNYHYMMNRFSDAGGVYSYAKNVFGADHGFLVAWFLILAYLAVLWANATSLPLFSRYFFGGFLHVGYLYSIFGYDVYLGEILLTIAALALFGALCMFSRRLIAKAMVAMALLFVVGITVCFVAAFMGLGSPANPGSLEPHFIPDAGMVNQIVIIACMTPWAFIGFENISHSTEEFSFARSKTFRIFTASIIATTLLYIFVILLSTTAFPSRYANWLEYINDLGNLQGIEALPPFYAAQHYLGSTGVTLLVASLLALILTSLIGNTLALSRLFYALAKDSVIPKRFAAIGAQKTPRNAILLVVAISLFIPFLGRTAIGWIVDVTTIGAVIVYCMVSAAAYKTAKMERRTLEKATGIMGLATMAFFGAMQFLPELFGTGGMSSESLILFSVWSVLGFVFFRYTLWKDKERRFGKSIIVWAALLVLVMFSVMTWMAQVDREATTTALHEVQAYYDQKSANGESAEFTLSEEEFINQEIVKTTTIQTRNTILMTMLFAFALLIMASIFNHMRRLEEESEHELGVVKVAARTDALTGVKNKQAYREWEQRLDERIDLGEVLNFAIVVCDLNDLKRINDTEGHESGDRYIRSSAQLICKSFKHSPVFRIGGDEFVVILEGDDYLDRNAIMEAFNKAVEANLKEEGAVISAGISDYIPHYDPATNAVFTRADSFMYVRKQELKQMGASARD